jgi:endonuclease III
MEELNKKKVEDLIAIGLYQARANKVKEYIMTLYKNYEGYLKPIDNVREILTKEIGKKSLSKEVIKLRRKEMR